MLWKPAQVLPQDKNQAVALFVALILAILTYTAYLVHQAVEQSKNPSTSFVLSNEVYKYPDVLVCLDNFFGCDSYDLEEKCVSSAVYETEGGRTAAVFNPLRTREQEIATEVILTEERGWCLSFETSAVEISGGERDPEDKILLDMYWYPGGVENASTTCVAEEGEWTSHSESVFIYLRDTDTDTDSPATQVSYSCMTSNSNSHMFTFMGIGLTKQVRIRGGDIAAYKAITTSSHVYKDERNANANISTPYAWLSMEIAQCPDSLNTITEIDPLEIAELFGNVGGFWDLLLIMWPIFFIAANREDPNLKARNFWKSVTSASAELPHPLRRTSKTAIGNDRGHDGVGEDDEKRPAWESETNSARVSDMKRQGSCGLRVPQGFSSSQGAPVPASGSSIGGLGDIGGLSEMGGSTVATARTGQVEEKSGSSLVLSWGSYGGGGGGGPGGGGGWGGGENQNGSREAKSETFSL